MRIGEKYKVRPAFSVEKTGSGSKMTGEVVYIHPEGRFAVLAFPEPGGTPREAFWPEELTEGNRVRERVKV